MSNNIKVLLKEAENKITHFPDEALVLLAEMKEDIERSGVDRDVALMKIYKGQSLIKKGVYEEAIMELEEARVIAKSLGYIRLYAEATVSIVPSLFYRNLYKECFPYISEILKFDFPDLIAKAKSFLGIVYISLNDQEKALANLFTAHEFFERANDAFEITVILQNIGYAYLHLKDFGKSEEYTTKAGKIAEKNGFNRLELSCIVNLGNVNYFRGQKEKAEEAWKRGLKKSIDYGFLHITSNLYHNLGELQFDKKNYDKSLEYYFQARNYAEKVDSQNDVISNLEMIQKIYAEKGDYPKAYEYLNLFANLQKEVFGKQRSDLLSSKVEEKEKEILSLKEENKEKKLKNRLLEQNNEELKQYAYIVAHDLKEPLRGIGGFLGLIKIKYGHLLPEQGIEYLDLVVANSLRMKDLLEGLLKYATVEREKIKKEEIDLEQIVSDVSQQLKFTMEEFEVSLKVEQLPNVIGNRDQIFQVFQNLIQNAIKFKSKERIKIDISSEEKDGCYLISIKDNGIGIKEQYLQSIFKIFKRVHKDKYKGTGIGLSICKKIMSLHHGDISVSSKENEGTTFVLHFPFR